MLCLFEGGAVLSVQRGLGMVLRYDSSRRVPCGSRQRGSQTIPTAGRFQPRLPQEDDGTTP